MEDEDEVMPLRSETLDRIAAAVDQRIREIADDCLGLQPTDADPIALLDELERTWHEYRIARLNAEAEVHALKCEPCQEKDADLQAMDAARAKLEAEGADRNRWIERGDKYQRRIAELEASWADSTRRGRVAAVRIAELEAELKRLRLGLHGEACDECSCDAAWARIVELEAEVAELRGERQREHDLRCQLAGELEGAETNDPRHTIDTTTPRPTVEAFGRTFTAEMEEISGFGGSYEVACRTMVLAAAKWLDDHPVRDLRAEELPGVFGIVRAVTKDAKELESAMVGAVEGGPTGAMVHACTNHAYAIAAKGWDAYALLMEYSPPGCPPG